MPTIKLDAGLFDSPEAVTAGPIAMYLHTAATAYCARYQTDGVISELAARRILDRDAILLDLDLHPDQVDLAAYNRMPIDYAERLVHAGLWEHDPDAHEYRIADYLQRHPSRAQLADQRTKRQAAGRKGGLARGKRDD